MQNSDKPSEPLSKKKRLGSAITGLYDSSLQMGKDGLSKVGEFNARLQKMLGTFIAKRIESTVVEQDRIGIATWLVVVREVVADASLSAANKTQAVYQLCDVRQTGGIVVRSFTEALRSIKESDLPLPLKVAIPITLAASTVIGGHGVGIVGFGMGIGLPALLIVFLGVAGITSTVEGLLGSKSGPQYLDVIAALIAKDEIIRRAKKDLQEAMVREPVEPHRFTVGAASEAALFASLYALTPTEFERHVMSYFTEAGYFSWVTKASNDAGVDGFVRHPKGLIVVQCKRYAADQAVGRPTVQQFKGVVEENNAFKGFVVCTSRFTADAKESAELTDKVELVDLQGLLAWSRGEFDV
jgi:restriction system protein